MEQLITAKYRWSVEDFVQANRYHLRHLFHPLTRFSLHVFFAILFLAGIGGLLTYPKPNVTSLAVQSGCIVAGLYWFVFRRFDFRSAMRRRYAKRPDKDSEVEWEIGPDKLAVRWCLGYSEFKWEAILQVVRTPGAVLLYPLDLCFYYLPRHGFSSNAEFEQVVELAKGRGVKLYRMA
jgi:hypothetical protein